MYLLDVHLPGSLLSVCLFESLRSLRFKAERRAERVWNTLSLYDHGFSDLSDGSLSVRGGSEWTREAECDGDEEGGRTEAIGRMAREELEAGLGRGRYAVGAEWDEGSMVHAIRRFGGRTIGWRYGNG